MNSDPIEAELDVRLLRADQVTQVRGVERPAEDPGTRSGYSLTWPEPSTTYL